MTGPVDRRAFLALLPGGVVAALGLLRPTPAPAVPAGAMAATGAICRGHRPAPTSGGAWEHPEPRPDVDGSRVLTAEQLTDSPHVIDLFDGIREIPHVADGIRCHCGCADLEGYRSLLSCYEGAGMARWCEICQGAARIAVGRTREGQTLDQIRRAIDARFGPAS